MCLCAMHITVRVNSHNDDAAALNMTLLIIIPNESQYFRRSDCVHTSNFGRYGILLPCVICYIYFVSVVISSVYALNITSVIVVLCLCEKDFSSIRKRAQFVQNNGEKKLTRSQSRSYCCMYDG